MWVGPRGAHPLSGWAHVGPTHLMGGPTWGPSGWAHVGPKWVGPCGAQVGGPTWGPSGWAHAGPKWVGPSQKFGTQKIKKIKMLRIKNRSAQNVGEVSFMPEKGVPVSFGALPANFLRGPEKSKKCQNFAYFPWWAKWALRGWGGGSGCCVGSKRLNTHV